MNRLMAYVMVGVVSLMLTACGFHLRGTGADQIQIKDMALSDSNNSYGAFIKELRERLQGAGVTIHDDAIYKLKVNDSWGDNRSLTFSNDIRGTEIERVLVLKYHIYGSGGFLLVDDSVEARGVFISDSNNIVANEHQQNNLDDRLHSEAIDLLMERLQGISLAHLDQLQQKAEEEAKLKAEAERMQQKALEERRKSLLNALPLEEVQKLNDQR